MKISLHEIAGEMLDILQSEEWTEEQEEQINQLNIVFEHKVDNVTRYQDNLQMAVDAIKHEENRLAQKRKALENRKRNLSDYLLRAMKAAGRTEVDVLTRKVAIQKNPPSVKVDDEQKIPARFFTIIPEQKQIDKKALKDALKHGEVEGAHLEQGERVVVR